MIQKSKPRDQKAAMPRKPGSDAKSGAPRKKSSRADPPVDLRPDETQRDEPILPGVNPVVADHDTPENSPPFPIVAIGASAGGLDAYKKLMSALPVDVGVAVVLVQHLDPKHHSMLAEILQRTTKLPVHEVENNMRVRPNNAYVIPPGKSLVFAHGNLQLAPRTEERGQHRPIDHFMRSLAEEHGHKAIGVVLSGTGNDGTLGMQEIKTAGGITFVQDDTAEQGSMPRSALASGSVDFVLPPDEIAAEIARIARHPLVAPATATPKPEGSLPRNDASVQRILELLRRETGVDFTNYKRNTLHRRILRRMVLRKIEGLGEYVTFASRNPEELQQLYSDILINVTSFFRNPEAYEALKHEVFPRLVRESGRHDQVRCWALGCSTGEEAYSLAMVFNEFLENSGERTPMQIFATDLNSAGIEKARAGIYSKGIEQDVSQERLRRFFTEIDGSYRIAKPIRDMCIFARQNALADPPFSRLDLVACRNMLIYLDPVLQQRLVTIMHYALKPGGMLWLGSSETIGSHRDLFELVDGKNKIYRRKPGGRPSVVVPTGGGLQQPAMYLPARFQRQPAMLTPDPGREADRALLSRYAPPGVVVNEELEILQFRGDTGPYLVPAPGRATLNLLKMLREGLLVGVRNALDDAKREGRGVREEGLRVKSNGGWRDVDVLAMPLKVGAANCFVVLFESHDGVRALKKPANEESAPAPAAQAAAESQEVERLLQELAATREYLQSIVEQQEAVNEELQASNEEVQSSNEELQSVNEELETSQEEIQSTNEELSTVNHELQSRNEELASSNADLANLLASVQMAIVMLDWDLRIRRFTPLAGKLLNLIPTDLGRPITDLKLDIEVPSLERILAAVLNKPGKFEQEVQDKQGRWYLLRVRHYQTAKGQIEGSVLVLVDIDSLKRGAHDLRESEARFEVLANSAPVLIWVHGLEGCQFVNRAFEEFVGAKEASLLGREWLKFIHPDDLPAFTAAYERAFAAQARFEAICRLRRVDGAYRWMKSVGQPRTLGDAFAGYVGSSSDITDLKEAEASLRNADRVKDEFLGMLAHELRNPLAAISNAAYLVKESKDEEAADHALTIVERQTRNMVRIVDDLLDVSRITHGKIHLRKQALDLRELLADSVNASEHDRKRLGQKIAVDTPKGPVWVEADPTRIEQVLGNLLSNASKFTPEGGHIWVKLGLDGDSQAVLRVRDDGLGIEPSTLEHMFELFMQGERTSAGRMRSGVGIGLTLARRIVELHGGTIEASSPGAGKGAEFVVRLPLAAAPKGAERRSLRRRDGQAGSRRVLLVEDNRDAAAALQALLTRAGHEVHLAPDGGTALEVLPDFRPDVVLLDLALPGPDGYEVARRLRAHEGFEDAMLIAVTGYGRDQDLERTRAAGFDHHLTKPVDPQEILALIGRSKGE